MRIEVGDLDIVEAKASGRYPIEHAFERATGAQCTLNGFMVEWVKEATATQGGCYGVHTLPPIQEVFDGLLGGAWKPFSFWLPFGLTAVGPTIDLAGEAP